MILLICLCNSTSYSKQTSRSSCSFCFYFSLNFITFYYCFNSTKLSFPTSVSSSCLNVCSWLINSNMIRRCSCRRSLCTYGTNCGGSLFRIFLSYFTNCFTNWVLTYSCTSESTSLKTRKLGSVALLKTFGFRSSEGTLNRRRKKM